MKEKYIIPQTSKYDPLNHFYYTQVFAVLTSLFSKFIFEVVFIGLRISCVQEAGSMTGMAVALREAEKALAEGEVPVGAALMRGQELLWADHNRREQLHDPTAHAEMLCLRHGAEKAGNWRLADCTLYVTLEPCPMCAGALVMSRVGKVVYGASDPEKGCCGSVYDFPGDPALSAGTRWQAGECASACGQLLSSFFRATRETRAGVPAGKETE